MHRLLALLAAATAQAAVIQGVVLEHSSGRPVARTIVRLQPVPDPAAPDAKPLTTRTGRTGHFVFSPVAPGMYILVATTDGFFPAAYGQRLPVGRGIPIRITAETDLFAELRLRHKGALTGRVFDENGVGRSGVPVLAYRAHLPLRSRGSALSDDRGIFRIPLLDPGKYWIRSGAATLDDGSGWLPTFGPQGRETRDARISPVVADADTTDADVSPEPGALFHLGGMIGCDKDGLVNVTLSSETSRRTVRSACFHTYRFDGVAPAFYEIFAQLEDGSSAGFAEFALDRDSDSGGVQLMQIPKVDIDVRRSGSSAYANIPVQITGRRYDLSESAASIDIRTPRATLAPGHWELSAHAPAGQYIESITNFYNAPRRVHPPEHPSGWFDVFIPQGYPGRLRITVSDQAGQINGTVLTTGGQPMPGAPIFLWPTTEASRRSLGGARETLSNIAGAFHFDSLPPGDYRVLASFDILEIDEDLIEQSHAPTVHAEARQTASIDLPIWTAP